MKKLIAQLLIAVFIGILFFYAGMRFHSRNRTEAVGNRENIRTIAVVNMDQGVQIREKVLNYGTQLVGFSNDYFYNTSLQDAQTGTQNGKYAAYVIIPAVFSERVWSVNTSPERAVLEYALNPNLREDIVPQVVYDLKGFEMKLNTDISYLYVYSILEEFHSGQDSAVTALKNGKADMKNLDDLDTEEFMEPLKFVELQKLEEYPQDMQLGSELDNMAEAGSEWEAEYLRSVDQTREELGRLFDDRNRVVWAKDEFYTSISGIKILENNNGDSIFGDGKEQLYSGMEAHTSVLAEERGSIRERFRWLARRDSLEQMNAETPNTWLAEIDQKHKSEKEAYREELETWRSSFDYTKLATPSVATPCNATPSNATPSNATPSDAPPSGSASDTGNWLLERDLTVLRTASGNLYGRIEADLEHLNLDEEQLNLILGIIRQNCTDEDFLRGQAATSSDAYPVMGSPDAEVYIRSFFESMPIYNGDLQEILDEISQKIIDFCQEAIEYIEGLPGGLFEWFKNIFELSVEEKLDLQEKALQDGIRKELGQFTEVFDEYNREFKRYTPFQDISDKEKNWFQRTLNENLAEVEKKINDKSKGDEELIIKIEKSKETDIAALQENIDETYGSASEKMKAVLERTKIKKKKNNDENEGLLHSFTQKLPYTRNGSAADTDTYEFIARPLEISERKLTGKSGSVSSKGSLIKISPVTGVLALGIIGLVIQNMRFRLREKKREEQNN